MKLIENIPLDTNIIANLFTDRDDMFLVWPKAEFPFNHSQWKEVLNPEKGNIPFLIYDDNQLIDHAALRKTEDDDVYSVSFSYIVPHARSKGMGEKMLLLLEKYAIERLQAKGLCLVVRAYNPRALRCYTKCGFKESGREDTLIRMHKVLQK